MPDEGEKRGLFWYLKQGIDKVDACDQTQWREFTKWYFDLLKNLFVVAALFALAKRTRSPLLEIAAGVSSIVILRYCYTYFYGWQVRLFHGLKSKRLAFWLDKALMLVFLIVLFFGTWMLLDHLINEIVEGNAK